jgi:hypothetical protein
MPRPNSTSSSPSSNPGGQRLNRARRGPAPSRTHCQPPPAPRRTSPNGRPASAAAPATFRHEHRPGNALSTDGAISSPAPAIVADDHHIDRDAVRPRFPAASPKFSLSPV